MGTKLHPVTADALLLLDAKGNHGHWLAAPARPEVCDWTADLSK